MSSVKDVDSQFERQLAGITPANANRITFNLGRPSAKVRSAGVVDKTIRLYGNKLMAKMARHGFGKEEVRGLTKAVRNPIAVFKNLERDGAYSILTTLKTRDGNFLVALDLGKGVDADVNMVSSVFGKESSSVVTWINRGYLRYVDKKKALNYLHSVAPIAAASDNRELLSAANIINDFENGKYSRENRLGKERNLRVVLGCSK